MKRCRGRSCEESVVQSWGPWSVDDDDDDASVDDDDGDDDLDGDDDASVDNDLGDDDASVDDDGSVCIGDDDDDDGGGGVIDGVLCPEDRRPSSSIRATRSPQSWNKISCTSCISKLSFLTKIAILSPLLLQYDVLVRILIE